MPHGRYFVLHRLFGGYLGQHQHLLEARIL